MTYCFEIPSDLFAEIIRFLCSAVTEGIVHCEEGKIWTRAVDQTNVCLVEVESNALFTEGEPIVVGWNLVDLKNIVEMVDEGDNPKMLHITVEPTYTRISAGDMKIIQRNLDSTHIKKEVNRPKLKFSERFTIPMSEFKRAVKFAGPVDNKIRISTEGKEIAFSVEGDATRWFIQPAEATIHERSHDAKSSLFNLDYLWGLVRVPSEMQLASIRFDNDYPMCCSWICGHTYFRFMLAPRIEEK